jgi:hypothetical protein
MNDLRRHRCVLRSGDTTGPGSVTGRSDRGGQFVECGSGAEVPVPCVGGEFVVAATHVLHECVATDDHPGSPVGLQSAHRL